MDEQGTWNEMSNAKTLVTTNLLNFTLLMTLFLTAYPFQKTRRVATSLNIVVPRVAPELQVGTFLPTQTRHCPVTSYPLVPAEISKPTETHSKFSKPSETH